MTATASMTMAITITPTQGSTAAAAITQRGINSVATLSHLSFPTNSTNIKTNPSHSVTTSPAITPITVSSIQAIKSSTSFTYTSTPFFQLSSSFSTTVPSEEKEEDVAAKDEPTLEMANEMTYEYKTMPNSNLILLAALDSPPIQEARAEVLKRHIMSVDKVNYTEASKTFLNISTSVHKNSFMVSAPYKLGIGTAIFCGFMSFPMCFNLQLVSWFNEAFVTTDVPEPRDLETWLEVGSWSWNWMEPPLGQISFFLLCLQFARGQIQNLGLKPYTELMKSGRAKRVAGEFSQYDETIISNYVTSVSFTAKA